VLLGMETPLTNLVYTRGGAPKIFCKISEWGAVRRWGSGPHD